MPGANDGLLSTSSLVLGVAAAHGNRNAVAIEGIAGLVAGSMSMAAGEFVSVHSQADTEAANLDLQAALVSAASFAVGAAMPLFATVIVPDPALLTALSMASRCG